MRALICVLLLGLSASAGAQPLPVDRWTAPLPTSDGQRIADVASWVTVATIVALDAQASWREEHRGRAFALQGARLGITSVAALVVKRLVRRTRPCAPACGMDTPDASFFSGHTAIAFTAIGGPRLSISLPLAVGSGGLRIAANKHWLTDVLVGAGVGAAISRIR